MSRYDRSAIMPDTLPAHRTPAHGRGAATTPLRILFAEDNSAIRKGLLLAFRRAGHHCEEAVDGREAQQILTRTPQGFDLVVTDHEMPFASGLDLVRQVRERSPATKVIVFSGSLTDELSRHYTELGVAQIYPKPASFSELLKAAASLHPGGPLRG